MFHSVLIFVIIFVITITIIVIIQSLFSFIYFVTFVFKISVSYNLYIKLCVISSSKMFDSISVLKIPENSPQKFAVTLSFSYFLAVGLRSTKNEFQHRYFLIFRRLTFHNFQKNYFIEHL